MRLYLDTADRSAARTLLATGLFAGVTTNPLILDRAGLRDRDVPGLCADLVAAGAREVFLQARGVDEQALAASARAMLALDERVVAKLPATAAGVAVAAGLVADGHRVLLTAVYHPAQVLVAIGAGCHYIAPYVGRMSDMGLDGVAAVHRMQQVIDRAGPAVVGGPTEVLAASVRDIEVLVDLAVGGVASATIGTALASRLLAEPATEAASAEFEAVDLT